MIDIEDNDEGTLSFLPTESVSGFTVKVLLCILNHYPTKCLPVLGGKPGILSNNYFLTIFCFTAKIFLNMWHTFNCVVSGAYLCLADLWKSIQLLRPHTLRDFGKMIAYLIFFMPRIYICISCTYDNGRNNFDTQYI